MTGWQGEKTTLWLGAGVGTGPWAQHTRDHSVGLAHGHVCTPYTHPVLLSGRRTRLLCHTHTHTHARTHARSQSRSESLIAVQGVGRQGQLLDEEREQHHHHNARAEQKHLLQGAPVGRGAGAQGGHWPRCGGQRPANVSASG